MFPHLEHVSVAFDGPIVLQTQGSTVEKFAIPGVKLRHNSEFRIYLLIMAIIVEGNNTAGLIRIYFSFRLYR